MNELNLSINKITDEMALEIGLSKLKKLSSSIRDNYRDKASKTDDYEVRSIDSARAYLIYRLPATSMVIYDVVNRIEEADENFKPKTILDLGSGPASSVYPLLNKYGSDIEITLLEEQASMKEAGEQFLCEIQKNESSGSILDKIKWVQSDFKSFKKDKKYDLVLASYMANELDEKELINIINAVTSHTEDNGIVVIIVPGVPEFFNKLLFLRNNFVSRGFNILSPCTFTGGCKMEGTGDWCHFYKRIQRSKALRYIKEGELPFEDEKYSYLVLSKKEPESGNNDNRIIRHPQIKKGMVELILCNKDGIRTEKITKSKSPDIFKKLKSAGWGDKLNIPE